MNYLNTKNIPFFLVFILLLSPNFGHAILAQSEAVIGAEYEQKAALTCDEQKNDEKKEQTFADLKEKSIVGAKKILQTPGIISGGMVGGYSQLSKLKSVGNQYELEIKTLKRLSDKLAKMYQKSAKHYDISALELNAHARNEAIGEAMLRKAEKLSKKLYKLDQDGNPQEFKHWQTIREKYKHNCLKASKSILFAMLRGAIIESGAMKLSDNPYGQIVYRNVISQALHQALDVKDVSAQKRSCDAVKTVLKGVVVGSGALAMTDYVFSRFEIDKKIDALFPPEASFSKEEKIKLYLILYGKPIAKWTARTGTNLVASLALSKAYDKATGGIDRKVGIALFSVGDY